MASGTHGVAWHWMAAPKGETGVFDHGGDAPDFSTDRDWPHIQGHVKTAGAKVSRYLGANAATALIWHKRPETYAVTPDEVVFSEVVGLGGMNRFYNLGHEEGDPPDRHRLMMQQPPVGCVYLVAISACEHGRHTVHFKGH